MSEEFDGYLRERGFQLKQGVPTREEHVPFLVLRKSYQPIDNMPALTKLEDQIIYVYSHRSFGGGWSNVGANEVSPSEWAMRIAEGCAAAELEENFRTSLGLKGEANFESEKSS